MTAIGPVPARIACTPFCDSGGLFHDGLHGANKAQFFETPMAVVTILELKDRSPDLLQVPEDATVNGLFLQRPVEAFSDAVGLRFDDEGEGEARRDTPEPTWLRKSSAVYCEP